MQAADFQEVKELKLPVYFFIGRRYNNIPATLVEEFAKYLKAPKKEVISFEKAGHGIMEEESKKFNKVILERILRKCWKDQITRSAFKL